jgi:hypothetical protein
LCYAKYSNLTCIATMEEHRDPTTVWTNNWPCTIHIEHSPNDRMVI